MESVPPRKFVHEFEPGELREQPIKVQHPDFVADAPRNVGRVLSVFLAEEVRGLVGAEVGLVDGAGQHQCDFVHEFVTVREPVGGLESGQNQSAHQ